MPRTNDDNSRVTAAKHKQNANVILTTSFCHNGLDVNAQTRAVLSPRAALDLVTDILEAMGAIIHSADGEGNFSVTLDPFTVQLVK